MDKVARWGAADRAALFSQAGPACDLSSRESLDPIRL